MRRCSRPGCRAIRETLTDPVVSPAGRGPDRAAHRQHRRERRRRRVARIWVAATWCATPRAGVELAVAARAGDDLAGRQVSASAGSTPARDPPPARTRAMRAGVFSGDALDDRRQRPGRRAAERCWPPTDARPTLAGEVSTPTTVRRPRRWGEAVHGGRPRPRHQGRDPAPHGRARHRGARAASTSTIEDVMPRSASTACSSATAPATRRRRPRGRARDRGARSTPPLFGICFGNQVLGRALGLRHLQAEATATAASTSPVMDRATGRSRSPRRTTGSRSTPAGRTVRAPLRPRPGQPRLG